jgi:hypothetical protein
VNDWCDWFNNTFELLLVTIRALQQRIDQLIQPVYSMKLITNQTMKSRTAATLLQTSVVFLVPILAIHSELQWAIQKMVEQKQAIFEKVSAIT